MTTCPTCGQPTSATYEINTDERTVMVWWSLASGFMVWGIFPLAVAIGATIFAFLGFYFGFRWNGQRKLDRAIESERAQHAKVINP